MKRIVITTALGVVAGIICALGGAWVGIEMTPATVGWVLLNRILLGFVIGISALRVHWALHGGLMGALVGSVFSYNAFLVGRGAAMTIVTLVMSVLFGFLIELFATVVFRQPQRVSLPPDSHPGN